MNNNFAERLKELRIEKKIGQIQLAKEIGVSKGIISLWENGLREPTLSSLIALAKFFEVSLDYLAGISEQ
ncbi:MAG: helix-turn-helix transcriptional regulator [Clostridiales bacterium]|nr:helix-turn-helix transcriptional regulator [Clostridiales bacterium]